MLRYDSEKRDKIRRDKLKKLRDILRDYYELLESRLSEWEFKKVRYALARLSHGTWPEKLVTPLYKQLGQFTHWRLSLPISVKAIVTGKTHYRTLVDAAKRLVLWANGDYIPAYRMMTEFQCKSDEHIPFHIHVALSYHRFRESDRELATGCPSTESLEYWAHSCERLFSVPPLVFDKPFLKQLHAKWAEELTEVLGVAVPCSNDLVGVTSCTYDYQVQQDRGNLSGYHASPLKTLMDDVDFYLRHRKGKGPDVHVTSKPRYRGAKRLSRP